MMNDPEFQAFVDAIPHRDIPPAPAASVFDRVTVRDRYVTAIRPKRAYRDLFLADREERFQGRFCSVAPRAGHAPTTER